MITPHDGVIFDLDGTLVDSAPDLVAALNHVLTGIGRTTLPAESVRAHVGQGAIKLIEIGLDRTGGRGEHSAEALRPLFLDYYETHIADQSQLFPGMDALLDTLEDRGVRLSVATNKTEALAIELLDTLALAARFDRIVGADTLSERKPHPAPLIACAEAMGSRAPIMVGDTITDYEAARAAAIPVILVHFGYSPVDVATLGADYCVDDPVQIGHIIDGQKTVMGGTDGRRHFTG